MQTELEIKAIKKRTVDTLSNSTKIFGVSGNEVKGNSADNEYNTNGDDSKKGGESLGSLVDHLNQGFDLTTGGDVSDQKARNMQLGYVIPGKITYSPKSYYSDADDIKVDTSLNVGQVVIY